MVYQARSRTLQRPAAVKMVPAGEFAAPTERLRFRLEAELAARVWHPNFVQVYEVGSHDSRPILATEWVDGGSLADRLHGHPWLPGEAVALVESLARATHVAHDEGVVHRDLKPADILLAADGTPKITDFGLAQPLEGGRTLTRSGILVGTPGYMAPEPAAGTRALVGPATDGYALGVVLYQLYTGRLPIQADSTLKWLRAVAADEPLRPRRLRPGLPRDLEAVTLRCLEKEPRHRYPSALALADDLGRFRAGNPVLARPAGAVTRLTRACRRRPLVAGLLALLALSLLAGMGGVTWKCREANDQRDVAVADKQAALYQAYRASLATAAAALESHDVADAARHLRAAPDDLRGWEWKHLRSRLDDNSAVAPVPPAEGGVRVAGADQLRVATRTADGVRLATCWGHTKKVVGVAFSPDGSNLVTASSDGTVRQWDWRAGRETQPPYERHTSEVTAAAYSPHGRLVASSGFDRTVRCGGRRAGRTWRSGTATRGG